MPIATCANIAAILAAATGGETVLLVGACPPITVSRTYPARVTVDASLATIAGLRVTNGGNLTWRGGRIEAADGAYGAAVNGYGVYLRNASDVTIENALLTAANRAIVLDHASRIVIANNIFDRNGSDGVIANASNAVNIIGNRFQNSRPQPTVCTFANGETTGLSQRDCVARGGSWTDGTHPDAIQLRNGMSGVLISGNTVTGDTQGIGQMDGTGDAGLRNVAIERNTVAVTFGNALVLENDCVACSVRWNSVSRGRGSTVKAVIRPGSALACGNTVEDGTEGTQPC